jgi:hypothetical protein
VNTSSARFAGAHYQNRHPNLGALGRYNPHAAFIINRPAVDDRTTNPATLVTPTVRYAATVADIIEQLAGRDSN